MEFSHVPVLLNECISSLNINPDGIYVDCTAGGGGHSAEILKRLKGGRMIMIDRDPDAIEVLRKRFVGDDRALIVNDNFSDIKKVLTSLNIDAADGILADLGVSSYQLDNPDRGFSFHSDAPLDMRMSKSGKSAYDVVNTYSQDRLAQIIGSYGEEKFCKSIARNIVSVRSEKSIETTFELVDIIRNSMPKAALRDGHPARKTFQAIRIEVNGELDMLRSSVEDMFEVLKVGGVLEVITFHSLEDKIVKEYFVSLTKGCICPREFPVCVCGKKPRAKVKSGGVSAGADEIRENPRSRSAKLRTAVKL